MVFKNFDIHGFIQPLIFNPLMKKNIFAFSTMALFLMLFVLGCQKVNEQPDPQTQTAKTSRKTKSGGNNTLLNQLVANVHFRSLHSSYSMLHTLHLDKINSLDLQGKRNLINLMASFDENTAIETRMEAFDISANLYATHLAVLVRENIALQESMPSLQNLTQQACTDLIISGFDILDLEINAVGACEDALRACRDAETAKNIWKIIGITW